MTKVCFPRRHGNEMEYLATYVIIHDLVEDVLFDLISTHPPRLLFYLPDYYFRGCCQQNPTYNTPI